MDFMRLRKLVFTSHFKLSFIGFILLCFAGFLNTNLNKPIINLTKQDTAINIDKDLLNFVSAGNRRLVTDLLWVQTLLESDNEHYKKKDLNNWLFLRFNTIASLDPKFYENYLFGGQFLAIIKDDLEGAKIIYEKGISHYPEDYLLNYNAGFLNYFERNDPAEGLKYLEKIEHHPRAPIFIRSIINKLKAATGTDLKTIFQLVLHHYESTQDKALKRKLRADLYAIKAELDLKCLNEENNSKCDRMDLDGSAYIYQDGKYRAAKEFLPYSIKRKGEN